jgi:hypothetical protein
MSVTVRRHEDARRGGLRIMKVALKGLLLTLAVLELACGGGSSTGNVIDPGRSPDPGPGTSPGPLTASFVPATFTPGNNLVTMAQGAKSGDTVTVNVQVSETSGLFGAGFNVTYNASNVTYVGWSPGGLLETGGNTVNYLVADDPSRGIVKVTATRWGSEPAIDVIGTMTLINLTFRVLSTGSFPLAFAGTKALDDAQIPSQPLPNISWYGGSLLGS